MANETIKHLWHRWSTSHVHSECGLRPHRITYSDMVLNIAKADCEECLKIRRENALRQAAECIDRRFDLLDNKERDKVPLQVRENREGQVLKFDGEIGMSSEEKGR